MFYPNQPQLNEIVYIVHCSHPDDNDESYAFNSLETCHTWCYKHDSADKNSGHPSAEVYEYRRVRKLSDEEVQCL